MKIIDNINALLGDDLKNPASKSKLKIASFFSIYAYEALKSDLQVSAQDD